MSPSDKIVLIIHIAAFTLTTSGVAINLMAKEKACSIKNIFGFYRCSTSAFTLFVTGVWLARNYIHNGIIPLWIILKFTLWGILFLMSAWASAKLEKNRQAFFYIIFLFVVLEVSIAVLNSR